MRPSQGLGAAISRNRHLQEVGGVQRCETACPAFRNYRYSIRCLEIKLIPPSGIGTWTTLADPCKALAGGPKQDSVAKPFGCLRASAAARYVVHSPEDFTVEKRTFEIVKWPVQGWRQLDPLTGDEAGTTEGEFKVYFPFSSVSLCVHFF